jgi:hypothetical protein
VGDDDPAPHRGPAAPVRARVRRDVTRPSRRPPPSSGASRAPRATDVERSRPRPATGTRSSGATCRRGSWTRPRAPTCRDRADARPHGTRRTTSRPPTSRSTAGSSAITDSTHRLGGVPTDPPTPSGCVELALPIALRRAARGGRPTPTARPPADAGGRNHDEGDEPSERCRRHSAVAAPDEGRALDVRTAR